MCCQQAQSREKEDATAHSYEYSRVPDLGILLHACVPMKSSRSSLSGRWHSVEGGCPDI